MESSYVSSRSFPGKPFRTLLVLTAAAMGWAGSASAAILQQISPSPALYVNGTDYSVMTYSALGDVTAPVWGVDILLGLGNPSTSGCEAADFAGFPAGSIALIQRGGACTFELKAENAAAAGALGALIFNQGNTVDRMGLLTGTLGPGYTGNIPVMGLPYALGVVLATTPGLTMRMQVVAEDLVPGTVPEPGTLALVGIAAAGLVAARRRRDEP